MMHSGKVNITKLKNKVATSNDVFQTRTKTIKGASTSTSMSVSIRFEVLGDLEDDGHLDALNTKDPKCDSRGLTWSKSWGDNENFMDDLVDDTRKKVGVPPRKTSIWWGREADSSSESGFTSPNHFDLLTKEDWKSILRNLQDSDDDAVVENGCDDTTTPSNSLGNSLGGNT
ncbi:hypothetical protein Tco_0771778 [Tanacetum coccineum]|uniref:Uncharacterized protein n=1 Tax=Tanacetum coccineum TaxID=301880 RepID=A0ABQ4ZJL9_9ASTR